MNILFEKNINKNIIKIINYIFYLLLNNNNYASVKSSLKYKCITGIYSSASIFFVSSS